MTRHTTFRFRLDPTAEQRETLARHAGAARFAYNQCLRMVRSAMHARRPDAGAAVPWSKYDLINAFNRWKKSESAGRVWAVGPDGTTEMVSAGLAWRDDVCQQVFEEAAVDCSRALRSWADRSSSRNGRRAGPPRFKKKAGTVPSFRMRNSSREGRRPAIRVGADGRPRSVTLPRVGAIAVRDDTRRLRRMIATGRARILFATVSHRGGRWWVSLNVEAADLHPSQRHSPRGGDDAAGWVGVDRGLIAFAVAATADGTKIVHVDAPPRPLRSALTRQRRLSRNLSRAQKGSHRRKRAGTKLRRHHAHVANVRKHFLHQVCNAWSRPTTGSSSKISM
nr:RNA-guided endonuclease TnpB family protein [Mycolicibacterium rutilum]